MIVPLLVMVPPALICGAPVRISVPLLTMFPVAAREPEISSSAPEAMVTDEVLFRLPLRMSLPALMVVVPV